MWESIKFEYLQKILENIIVLTQWEICNTELSNNVIKTKDANHHVCHVFNSKGPFASLQWIFQELLAFSFSNTLPLLLLTPLQQILIVIFSLKKITHMTIIRPFSFY